MPIPNDYTDIVRKLAETTDQGRVIWSEVTFGYEVAILKSRLRIYSGTDEDDRGFVSVTLNDANGKNIDNWYVDQGEQDFDFMYRLVAAAKRYAHGIPDRLSAIKTALESSKMIGGDDDIPF